GENHPMFGNTHSAQTKAKISEAKLGENHPMFGKSHSAESILKLSIANGGGTIYIYDTQGLLVNSFSSARKTAEYFNCNHKTIMRYVRNNKLFQDKWYLSNSENFKVITNNEPSDCDK